MQERPRHTGTSRGRDPLFPVSDTNCRIPEKSEVAAPPPPHVVLTIRLVVERHQLNAVQPEEQRVWVGGVDAGRGGVRPEQLALGVLDQLLGVPPAQALRRVLVHGGDVVALGRADDGAQRGGGVEDGRCLLLLPAQPLGAT